MTALEVVCARVDNRLVHGQILEVWVPKLSAEVIVVADDEVATNTLMRSAMQIALPRQMRLLVARVEDVAAAVQDAGPGRALVLFRDIKEAVRAHDAGLAFTALDVGNVHFMPGRKPITPSIYLAQDEIEALGKLAATGVQVEIRTLPSDRPLSLFAGVFAKGA